MMHPGKCTAFSLLEVLLVLGLGAVLTLTFMTRPSDASVAAALEAARCDAITFLSAARLQAVASGRDVRVLVGVTTWTAETGERFRRELVMQEQTPEGGWISRATHRLPAGICLLPHLSRMPAHLWDQPTPNAAIHSTALAGRVVRAAIGSTVEEEWDAISLSAHGTTGTSGTLVFAPIVGGRIRKSDVSCTLQLSAYGIAH